MLEGDKVFLRQVEPKDAVLLLAWENDEANWMVSGTEAPYSMHAIEMYIASANEIRANKQLRLMICNKSSQKPVGAIDLYDINFKYGRAGIGVLIAAEKNRRKGFAKESIELCINYGQQILAVTNFYCTIQSNNVKSVNLFKQIGFKNVGIKKNWFKIKEEWVDEYIFQFQL